MISEVCKGVIRRIKQVYTDGYKKDSKIGSEYDLEIPQSQTADNPMAPRVRVAQPS